MIEAETGGRDQKISTVGRSPDQAVPFLSDADRTTIARRQQLLSSLSRFIGRDFTVPVNLGKPGEGWKRDEDTGSVTADPTDLAQASLDSLRYRVSSEAGKQRISRPDTIPSAQRDSPGYLHLQRTLETARANNFVAENYPKFAEHIDEAERAGTIIDARAIQQAQEQFGFIPRFLQASQALTQQWYDEMSGNQADTTSDTLSPEVSSALSKIRAAAHDAWWQYPSREEADSGEDRIREYARATQQTINNRIWPEFQKLIDQDIEDAAVQQMLKGMGQPDQATEGNQQLQELNGILTPKEQQELEQALQKSQTQQPGSQASEQSQQVSENESNQDNPSADGQTSIESRMGSPAPDGEVQNSTPIDLDSLPDDLMDKLKKFMSTLPKDKQEQLKDQAKQRLKQLEDKLNQDREIPTSQNVQGGEQPQHDLIENATESTNLEEDEAERQERLQKFRQQLQERFQKDENAYESARRRTLPIIDKLESDLREIFVKRRANKWQTNNRYGKRIDIGKRIQEKARKIPAIDSKAWQRREQPDEKDYAISLLVDVTTSMLESGKMDATFDAAVALSEALNRLSIATEILAFNQDVFAYQSFGETMSDDIRRKMGEMLEIPKVARKQGLMGTATGWAIRFASERLARQKEEQKFMFVLTDGRPWLPDGHPKSGYKLKDELKKIKQNTNQKVIGVGIGPDTEFVRNFFSHSMANVNVQEMADKLSDLLRNVIANYDEY